ncbi:CHASE3 domain-containing protein [Spirulina major CS-329]|uniref:sensor histidine kinase n=1 Tax=Spirulina TaxID=1154 RepID=UPI00232B45FF|nr:MULTISPECIES: CHASE3 domain-containing protein [Spirulina]MDB9494566.1 CHASE3 domain-containing protein [Spirulina subsalsa CS-330]MDB9503992.1 CHASE3 domain-containing protein [Spirulina major CS-329]
MILPTLAARWQALPVRVRGNTIIAIPILCLITSLSAVAWLKMSLTEDEMWVQHTQVVRLESKRLLNALIDAETGMRGYGLTQREEFLAPYYQAQAVIPRSLTRLENLVQDNPAQVAQMQVIREQVDATLALLVQKISLQRGRQQGQPPDVNGVTLYDWLNAGKAAMDATRQAIDQFAAVEEQLLQQRQAHQDHYQRVTWYVLWISGGFGLVGTALAIHLFWHLERELTTQATQLQTTNRQLTAACTQLERFTANASHELRTPLAAILSNAQVGLMDWEDWEEGEPPPAGVRQRLTKIVTLTKHMSELVRQLLWLARQEGNDTQPPPFGAIDLAPWLQQWANEGQSQATAAGLTFTAEMPATTIAVCGDGALLGQAVINVLTNACRYTPAPGAIAFRVIPAAAHMLLEVQDTGPGIPAAALPHLCEPFYRVNPSGAAAGFGLGLAIAQQIVRVHGGELRITSEVGAGTTVAIALPRLP